MISIRLKLNNKLFNFITQTWGCWFSWHKDFICFKEICKQKRFSVSTLAVFLQLHSNPPPIVQYPLSNWENKIFLAKFIFTTSCHNKTRGLFTYFVLWYTSPLNIILQYTDMFYYFSLSLFSFCKFVINFHPNSREQKCLLNDSLVLIWIISIESYLTTND